MQKASQKLRVNLQEHTTTKSIRSQGHALRFNSPPTGK
jgi:hypothetical protein